MAPFVQGTLGWLRRTFAWSRSWQSWQERLGFLTLVIAAFGLWWFRPMLALSAQVVFWSLVIVFAAVLSGRGWFRLFGPMLFYDLVRIARRQRYFLLRSLYAILLSLLVGWVYWIWSLDHPLNRLNANEMAQFAESFFYTFMIVQFLVMAILTPAYVAGAVAEEKERKTLEFLLATDLRNREIVLSKLAARLANLTLLVLTGLPILSFLQFLGGMDPNLVVTGFIATGVTIASLAGLSMLNSVLTKKPRDAIALTYLSAAAYLLLSGASWLLLLPNLGLANFPSSDDWTSPITVESFVEGFNIGNPIALCVRLINVVSTTGNLGGKLWVWSVNYWSFHGFIAVACSAYAVVRLRAIALKQSYGKAQKLSLQSRLLGRPRIGNHPMLWKEIFAEPGLRFNMFSRIVVAVLIIASFIPVAFIFAEFIDQFARPTTARGWGYRAEYNPWQEFGGAMNVWVRILGTIVACLMLLAVAARAASSLSSERDRQTLDGLLTTPLDSDSILLAKWIGNVLSVRWAWLWLGLIYGLGLLTGGLHPFAVPLLGMAWFVYATVLSGIGLWFSLVSRTSLRATIWTFLATGGAGVGHWLFWMCCVPLFATGAHEPAILRWIVSFQLGFTPPIALGYALSFREDNLFRGMTRSSDGWETIGFAFLGLFCWGVIAAALWATTSARFRKVSGRTPLKQPLAPDSQVASRSASLPDPTADGAPDKAVLFDGKVGDAPKIMPDAADRCPLPEPRSGEAAHVENRACPPLP